MTLHYAVVPCAGVGVRAGASGPKQYRPVVGRPVVAHTLQALQWPGFTAVLVVLSPHDTQFEDQVLPWMRQASVPLWVARVGGATRAESVQAGLQALAERGAQADDWVWVHDAARPGLPPDALERLAQALHHHPDGALLALPVADTLKREAANAEPVVHATVPRQGLWAAQTPQVFRHGPLSRALLQAQAQGLDTTDDASAMERAGYRPGLVPGHPANFKLTHPSDFAWAEQVLRSPE